MSSPNTRPAKPSPEFPLNPDACGQWAKKFHGRKVYFGSWKTDPTGERALADYNRRKDDLAAGVKIRVDVAKADGMTLGELLGKYLANARHRATAEHTLSLRTLRDLIIELTAFVDAIGPTVRIADLRPEHFTAYNELLVGGGRPLPDLNAKDQVKIHRGRPLGPHARKRVIAYVKAMLHWGAGNGWFAKPAFGHAFRLPNTSPDAMRMAKRRAGKRDYSDRVVTGEELDRILERCSPQFKAIVLIAINCGLGPADIGRLRWRDIDVTNGTLDLPRWKTGVPRKGYLWRKTRKALERVRTLKRNRQAIEKDGVDALVFVSRCGQPVYREREVRPGVVKVEQCLSITFGRIVRELGVDGVTLYRLRHSFKTLGKRAKDRDTLNLMMGHREGTTGEVYDHEDIDPARIKRVAIKIYRALWPKADSAKASMTPQTASRHGVAGRIGPAQTSAHQVAS
jgi:integrase